MNATRFNLPLNIDQAGLVLFADDTSVIFNPIIENATDEVVNDVLQRLIRWFGVNGLIPKFQKTNYIHFCTTNGVTSTITVAYEPDSINRTEYCKFLGLYIGENVHWKKHVSELLKQLNSDTFALSIIPSLSNERINLLTCIAYFYSIMSYGIIFWSNSSLRKKVLIVQKRAVIICGVRSQSPCRNLLKEFGISTAPSKYVQDVSGGIVNILASGNRPSEVAHSAAGCASRRTLSGVRLSRACLHR